MLLKKERQNYYFLIVTKTGGLQFFVQFKELYREGLDDNGHEQIKVGINQALSAASTFYAIDAMNSTIVPQAVFNIESEKDPEFHKNNSIDVLVTDQYIVSQFQTITGLRFITLSGIHTQTPKQLSLLSVPQIQQAQQQYQSEISRKHDDNLQRMRQIYRLYTDYFSKDPFQSEDQPLGEKRRQAFERDIRELLDF